jgi:hypothetical protein
MYRGGSLRPEDNQLPPEFCLKGGNTMLNKKMSRRSFLTISAMTAASFALDWKKIAAYAATMGPKGNYPTVIIGAGLRGLCCGAYLSRFGIPVTVVEQHDIPGGYATSFDRSLKPWVPYF